MFRFFDYLRSMPVGASVAIIAGIVFVVILVAIFIRRWQAKKLLEDYGIVAKELTSEDIAKANAEGGRRDSYVNGLMTAAADGSVKSMQSRYDKQVQAVSGSVWAQTKLAYDLNSAEGSAESEE
ncbi:MAG: hypothetical protein LBN43_00935 [Oscillospiraceae bacterium]|jgi:hypothetical protein|nr:hypothetical protein [Oscillospiraceae bacterium]